MPSLMVITGFPLGKRNTSDGVRMLLLSVELERWYTIEDAVPILGWERDTIIRLIDDGFLQAQIKPRQGNRRKRIYLCRQIQGCELVRFVKDNLSVQEPLRMNRKMY